MSQADEKEVQVTAASVPEETQTPGSVHSAQREKQVQHLERRKQSLQRRISSLEKLDLLINVLTYKIFQSQYEHRKEMEDLVQQKEEVVKRSDLTSNQIALTLAELDKTIADKKNTHEATLASLEGQRQELRRESARKIQHLDALIDAITTQHDTMLEELEEQKLNASVSHLEEIALRIEELNRLFKKDLEMVRQMQEQGWKEPEEKISQMLESRGLHVTLSGNLLTQSGRHLTRSEASCLGLLEGIDLTGWQHIFRKQSDIQICDSETTISSSKSTDSLLSKMSVEDTHYLKLALGKALTLALAEITAKQPRDPIHYLGHWLFKYRYNQETDIRRKQQIEDLIAERDRLEKEKLRIMLQEEARAVLLDLVVRAEEEAVRRELERIAREAAMMEEAENEENDEAAILAAAAAQDAA